MPLEALRWDVTPVGLHYLLVHYDIPDVDPATWRLEIGGCVERPLSCRSTTCAPEARRRDRDDGVRGQRQGPLEPRAISQPWLQEAVGTGRWGGVRLADLLAEAGPTTDAVEALFTGLDRGVEGGVAQAYQRSVPLDEALAPEVLLAYDLNGAPLPPQHGFPLRLVVPGWYGMTNVKWLASIDAARPGRSRATSR